VSPPVPAFDWIGHHADSRPNDVALIYADLEDHVHRPAAWLEASFPARLQRSNRRRGTPCR
jgi:hypothetical protein